MLMKKIKNQKGVGIVEVLVALLLLAVGVLGYVALQLRAVEASSEALNRSQALVVMRSVTESIRANVAGQSFYPTAMQRYTDYTTATAAPTSCLNSACTPSQLANYEAYESAKMAYEVGIKVTMTDCPGVSTASVKRQCIFGAWGNTAITSTSYANCMSNDGTYLPEARCVMMEAY
ncbi:MAG: type IV pilus modification protein PilV [Pedobacter sp.]|nr:MAG: type IV pilus modification protein PilV [Pedobacter sp.]